MVTPPVGLVLPSWAGGCSKEQREWRSWGSARVNHPPGGALGQAALGMQQQRWPRWPPEVPSNLCHPLFSKV